MSRMDDLVSKLAWEFGLSAELLTMLGGSQPRSTHQLAALLAAGGYPCGSEAQAADSLARLRARKYGTGGFKFTPVLTLHEGQPAKLTFIRPDDARNKTLELRATPVRPKSAPQWVRQVPLSGARHVWSPDFLHGHQLVECEVTLGADVPPGIYDVEIAVRGEAGKPHKIRVFKAPEKCPRPKSRSWGCAMQLPSTWGSKSCGRGNFGDLITAAKWLNRYGGRYLGVSPFFLSEGHPYFNMSLTAWDWTQMSPDMAATTVGCPRTAEWLNGAARSRIEELRRADPIDADGVRAFMADATRRLFDEFDPDQHPDYAAFKAARGYLRSLGVYLTKRTQAMSQRDNGWDHRTWGNMASPAGSGIEPFAAANDRNVEFHSFAQWLAHSQLTQVRDACRELGVELYLDRPVSAAPGFDEWEFQEAHLSGLETGAPGDAFNPNGQTWGSLPLWLTGLRECLYEPLVRSVDLLMSVAGLGRLDHFMWVQRIFGLLRGGSPNDGAYLYTCIDEVLDILVLLAHLNECPIVGEDLGTVDPAVRKAMVKRGIFGMPIVLFEHDRDGEFHDQSHYQPNSVTSFGSHDLPSTHRWLSQEDLLLAHRLGQINGGQLGTLRARRARMKDNLKRRVGCSTDDSTEITHAVYTFLGNGPCEVVMLNLEDAEPTAWQPNVPGTRTGTRPREYPNYGKPFPCAVDRIPQRAHPLFKLMQSLRG